MKRSKMISILLMVIPGDEYWGPDYQDADRALTAMEEAGMLPPTTKVQNPFGTEDDQGNKYPGSMIDANVWDPE